MQLADFMDEDVQAYHKPATYVLTKRNYCREYAASLVPTDGKDLVLVLLRGDIRNSSEGKTSARYCARRDVASHVASYSTYPRLCLVLASDVVLITRRTEMLLKATREFFNGSTWVVQVTYMSNDLDHEICAL